MPIGVVMVLGVIFGLLSYIGLYFSPKNSFLEGVLGASVIVFALAFIRFLIAVVVGAARSR